MKSKIISGLLIFSIIFSIFSPVIAVGHEIDPDVTFRLESNATEIKVGEQIEVEMYIDLENSKQVDTFSGYLQYDEEILEFNEEEEFTTNNQTKFNSPDYVNENGEIQIEATRSNANSGKEGLMYTITFNVLKTTNSTKITLEDEVDCAFKGEDIWCKGATLTIPKDAEVPEEPKEYNITYNTNANDTVNDMPNAGKKKAGESYTIEGTTPPTRTGYTFKGWNTDVNGSGQAYSAGDKYNTDADLTLYAQWEQIKSTLTVDPNGGTWEGSSKSQSFTEPYGTQQTLLDPTVTPKGHTVKFNVNGGTPTTLQLEQKTKFDKWTLETGGGTLKGATYTFADTDATVKANYIGEEIQLPSVTKANSTFSGWYTAQTGGERVGDIGEDYTPEKDITLFAHWDEVTYTLTIHPNRGTWNGKTDDSTITGTSGSTKAITDPVPPEDSYTVTLKDGENTTQVISKKKFDKWTATGQGSISGVTYTFGNGDGEITATYKQSPVQLETPTKEGYTFDGWYTQQTDGEKINTPYTPEDDITLYARWTPKKFKITFDTDGVDEDIDGTEQDVTYGEKYGDLPIPERDGYEFDGWYDEDGNKIDPNDKVDITENKKLTAGWLGDEYTVTFDYEGGTGTVQSKTVRNEGRYGELPQATKEGHKFLGWYDEQDHKIEPTTIVNITGDITLHAKYEENKYTITFKNDDGTTISTVQVKYGEEVGLDTPTKKGYEFDGWYTEQKGGTKIETPYIAKGDATLYAHWTPKKYQVTFDTDGEDPEIEAKKKEVTYGEKYGELPEPSKEGNKFLGWYDDEGNKIDSSTNVDITEDTTLHAKFEKNKYTITFKNDDGTTINTVTAEHGEEVSLNKPAKEGYTFDGWYTEQKGGTKIEAPYIAKGDATLYAHWTPKKYQVTFDTDGEDPEIEEQKKEVTYGDEYGELPEPSKEGHKFLGWYDDEGNKVDPSTNVDITEDTTLHARFEKNKYTVTFKNDDGTIINTVTVEHGEKAEYTGEIPTKNNTKPGYKATFKGWQNEDSLENVTGDITVTAQYDITPIEYTITYKNLKDSDNSANPTKYTVEDEDIPLVDLQSKENATFKGWYTTNNDQGEKVTSIDTSKLENITLYAQWEEDKLYLRSEKYKVGKNNIDEYEEGDIYLDKIEPETTVAEFIENCDTNGIITVIDKNGKTLKEDELVGTGMTIKDKRYEEEITMTAVVMGDLDGNGYVTVTDLSALNQVILKEVQIQGAEFLAADLDDNEKLTVTDLSTINNTILETITLTYTKIKKQENN